MAHSTARTHVHALIAWGGDGSNADGARFRVICELKRNLRVTLPISNVRVVSGFTGLAPSQTFKAGSTIFPGRHHSHLLVRFTKLQCSRLRSARPCITHKTGDSSRFFRTVFPHQHVPATGHVSVLTPCPLITAYHISAAHLQTETDIRGSSSPILSSLFKLITPPLPPLPKCERRGWCSGPNNYREWPAASEGAWS